MATAAISVFWFRRDLRLQDNAGLFHALKSGLQVLPIFIFDENILSKLSNQKDPRVDFIHQQLQALKTELKNLGSDLEVRYGKPTEVWKQLLEDFSVKAVYTNHDYEPYAIKRDERVKEIFSRHQITFQTFKDQVIFEKLEVTKKDGKPYTVFTPYSRKWKEKLLERNKGNEKLSDSFYLKSYPCEKYFNAFYQFSSTSFPSLKDLGFESSNTVFPSSQVSRGLIRNYAETRDFPIQKGTSRLGIHFRFGTISIREKAKNTLALSETFLNELIWRDFYAQILSNFPHVEKGPFRPEYDFIEWRNNEQEFEAWTKGQTGYPIVDAGMRELNETGFMHNRVRMITASFLAKHLLIDWSWGEAYFAEKLLDFDLASNNGGWQWAAGCGTDAAPYFRIFSPDRQQQKFDKNFEYIKKWIPEFGTESYPKPIVDHAFARKRCLEVYKKGIEMGRQI